MRSRVLVGMVLAAAVLALPASAGAANLDWTYALYSLTQNENNTATMTIENASGSAATVTYYVDFEGAQNRTIGPGDSVTAQSMCTEDPSCYLAAGVASTTPDLQITLQFELYGPPPASAVLTQSAFELVGPNGDDSLALGTLASADGTGFSTLQTTTSTLASDFGPIPEQVKSTSATIAKLEQQVSTLTADVNKLTKLLEPKKKSKKKHR